MTKQVFVGGERCEILKGIEAEFSDFDSIPVDQKRILLWAIDYILKFYRCRV